MRVIKKMSVLIVAMALSACEREVEREIVVEIDEEKLGRAIGRKLMLESQMLNGDRLMEEQEQALPSQVSSQGVEECVVNLEITSSGALYGTNEGKKTLLAESFEIRDLYKAKDWLAELKAQSASLKVSLKVDEKQSQENVVSLLNLLGSLDINQITFSE